MNGEPGGNDNVDLLCDPGGTATICIGGAESIAQFTINTCLTYNLVNGSICNDCNHLFITKGTVNLIGSGLLNNDNCRGIRIGRSGNTATVNLSGACARLVTNGNSNSSIQIGGGACSTGYVTMSDGLIQSEGAFQVGSVAGSTGTLITTGGSISAKGFIGISTNPTGSGYASLTDTNVNTCDNLIVASGGNGGTLIVNGTSTVCVSGAFRIAANGGTGYATISGSHDITVGAGITIGNCCATEAIMSITGSSACATTINTAAEINVGNDSQATLLVSCANITAGAQVQVGAGPTGDGTMIVTNSKITTSIDFDIGETTGSTGYFTATNSCLTATQDFIVGQIGGGSGTAYISGGTHTIGGGLAIADCACNGSGYVTLTGGAHMTTCGGPSQCTSIGIAGSCRPAQLNISGGSTLTTNNDIVTMNNVAILDLCNGTVAGSSTFRFTTGASIRGCGHFDAAISLRGGEFTVCGGDVLEFGGSVGSITQNTATDDFIIKGGGTIAIGSDNPIADAIDMVINDSGTLSMGSGFSETINNLTLTAASTIDFGSGDHALQLDGDLDLNGTLTITDWGGTAGASNTSGGKLYVTTIDGVVPTVGTGYTGITFSGYAATTYDVIAGPSAGLFEIVPTGSAVPESSTWISAGGALLLLAVYDLNRRRKAAGRLLFKKDVPE